jgi:hypothetical protein
MCKSLDNILEYIKTRDNYKKEERNMLRLDLESNIKEVSSKFVSFLDDINSGD